MEPVLNELSMEAHPEGADLDARMLAFIATLRRLFEHGMTRVLRTVRGVLERAVSPEMTLRQWLFSKSAGALREAKQLLQRLLDKAPYVEDLHAEQEGKHQKLFEVRLGDNDAPGLGVALLRDAPAVSLAGDPRFSGTFVRVRMTAMGAEGEGEEQDTDVVHAASAADVEQHRQWMEERVQRDVVSGEDLWKRRASLFPALDFCPQVERHVSALSGSEFFFCEIIRHLHVMSRSVVRWADGDLELPGLRWSHESKETLNHGTYGPMRNFTCPDGMPRQFSLHSKINTGAKRIHFLPDKATKRILIGYVGDHLPTVRHHN